MKRCIDVINAVGGFESLDANRIETFLRNGGGNTITIISYHPYSVEVLSDNIIDWEGVNYEELMFRKTGDAWEMQTRDNEEKQRKPFHADETVSLDKVSDIIYDIAYRNNSLKRISRIHIW